MEKLFERKPILLRAGLFGGLAALTLGACAFADLNPAPSVTHGAKDEGGATQEILHNYPDATDIQVTHANDNPNYMSWTLEDGTTCTAFASQTKNRGETPGRLVSEPYCREIEGEG